MSRPLRVLVVGNFSRARCGIANYAHMTLGGLQRTGASVDHWDATYDGLYARREAGLPTYLPDNWADYDVIHHNWHPVAFNFYVPEHFHWPKGSGPLVSVYLNDIPPWSGCPFLDRCEAVIAAEPTPVATLVLPYPIPDWVTDLPEPASEFTVGVSGVREDGFQLLREVCERHHWTLAEKPAQSGSWTSPEEEIRRLARNSVNVCWYAEGRGIAGTPSMALGSRRPLLLNQSSMFAPWWEGPYKYELYLAKAPVLLERALSRICEMWQVGTVSLPGPKVYQDHGWATEGPRLLQHWQETLEAR